MKKSRSIIPVLLAFGCFSLFSCGEEKKDEEVEETVIVETTETQEEVVQTDLIAEADVKFNNEALEGVFEAYIEVKNALVASNAAEAKEAANNLKNELEGVEVSEALKTGVEKIANSTDINEQRTAFVDVTAGVETLVEGSVEAGVVYKQYCPMAFEGEGGYWLSTSEEIRNPYYGDAMLKCGSVEKKFE